MDENEVMRKYAEAHGCGGECEVVRPVPCVRVGEKIIKNCNIKQHFAKINEELDELKEASLHLSEWGDSPLDDKMKQFRVNQYPATAMHVAEEAADVVTAITTMLEALGIDAAMRNEAQRRVNRRNLERGRL